MVTPFNVTVPWLRVYTRALSEGLDETEAKAVATTQMGIKGKDFARCVIRDRILTIPVAGGSAILKNPNASPLLSNHGKWRREHLGAWNAAYGRTPFFIHLMPELEAVYNDSLDLPLEEFNSRLLSLALSWLDLPALSSLPPAPCPLSAVRCSLQPVRCSLTIFDLLFHIGPEALFALI